ncbi:hypothetical protein Ctha_0664 [Chloroherpeton thalassium ATCC 35110]|uniref:Uncharacterized protein n=1 Tax=Chloroherpeton thalassium (strain ATCC 35110 / GB-78) TaxID=517418 RepID=B3QVS6_CHLT3|nr:hypothetical protein Ctha_0664 [Chloroherpeton thalassium ATCC 35110]
MSYGVAIQYISLTFVYKQRISFNQNGVFNIASHILD